MGRLGWGLVTQNGGVTTWAFFSERVDVLPSYDYVTAIIRRCSQRWAGRDEYDMDKVSLWAVEHHVTPPTEPTVMGEQ